MTGFVMRPRAREAGDHMCVSQRGAANKQRERCEKPFGHVLRHWTSQRRGQGAMHEVSRETVATTTITRSKRPRAVPIFRREGLLNVCKTDPGRSMSGGRAPLTDQRASDAHEAAAGDPSRKREAGAE